MSKRSRTWLTDSEVKKLKHFVETDAAPFATITKSCGVNRRTVLNAIRAGFLEFGAASKLRQIIPQLPAKG